MANTACLTVTALEQSSGYTLAYSTDWSTETKSGDTLGPWTLYRSRGNAVNSSFIGYGFRDPNTITTITSAEATRGGKLLRIRAENAPAGYLFSYYDHTANGGAGGSVVDEDISGKVISGGMNLTGSDITYGKVRMRARVDVDPTKSTSQVALMWPSGTSPSWPDGGEIDFWEGWAWRDTRFPAQANNHWANPPGVDQSESVHYGVSAADWHVYEMIWTPNLITVAADGETPRVLSNTASRIPDWTMWMTLQLDAWNPDGTPWGTQPNLGTNQIDMLVDWVEIYEAA